MSLGKYTVCCESLSHHQLLDRIRHTDAGHVDFVVHSVTLQALINLDPPCRFVQSGVIVSFLKVFIQS